MHLVQDIRMDSMLNYKRFDRQKWINERQMGMQNFKLENVKYLDTLCDCIENALKISEMQSIGNVMYANGDAIDVQKSKTLYYNYGSPMSYLCKLLPDGYGFTHHKPNDIWKKCHIESGLHQKLINLYNRGHTTRYKQLPINQEIVSKLPVNYILVPMQNVGETVWYRKNFTLLAEEMIAWSRENKTDILFKWHNGCIDHYLPQRWWSEDLKEKSQYAHFDYHLPLPYLIKNCQMVWTASSMSGIEALICNKPVATFGEVEYSEMAKLCSSVEDAYTAKLPSQEDLERWFTYYVRKYSINIYDTNVSNRIHTRLVNFFEKDMPIDELILS